MKDIEAITPLDNDALNESVQGVIRAGKVLVKGLIGEQVIVVTTSDDVHVGVCGGFLTVNRDMDVRDPHLTIQTEKTDDCTRTLRLPPGCIASIEPLNP